ncbi:MAG: hypothetical protein BMS9Abin02_0332 [Anaerolineae bacterium]|nr:MAG: hypothetical protein BMS9Abin02_0332 [Anaerolineae bacterium]
MISLFITLLDFLYYAIFILLIARFILTVSTIGPYQLREWVFRLTEPLLAPIRRLLPSSGGADFSPLVLLLGIWLLRVLLLGFLD